MYHEPVHPKSAPPTRHSPSAAKYARTPPLTDLDQSRSRKAHSLRRQSAPQFRGTAAYTTRDSALYNKELAAPPAGDSVPYITEPAAPPTGNSTAYTRELAVPSTGARDSPPYTQEPAVPSTGTRESSPYTRQPTVPSTGTRDSSYTRETAVPHTRNYAPYTRESATSPTRDSESYTREPTVPPTRVFAPYAREPAVVSPNSEYPVPPVQYSSAPVERDAEAPARPPAPYQPLTSRPDGTLTKPRSKSLSRVQQQPVHKKAQTLPKNYSMSVVQASKGTIKHNGDIIGALLILLPAGVVLGSVVNKINQFTLLCMAY